MYALTAGMQVGRADLGQGSLINRFSGEILHGNIDVNRPFHVLVIGASARFDHNLQAFAELGVVAQRDRQPVTTGDFEGWDP